MLLREVTSKFQVKTLTKQPTTWRKRAAILSNSIVGICPELSEIKVKINKKEFPGFILEKHLYDGLRKLCNLNR